MNWRKHFFLIASVTVITLWLALLVWKDPCRGDLFFGLCLLMKIFVVLLTAFFLINFIVLSTLLARKLIKRRQSKKSDWVFIYLYSLVAAGGLAPTEVFLSAWVLRIGRFLRELW